MMETTIRQRKEMQEKMELVAAYREQMRRKQMAQVIITFIINIIIYVTTF